MTYVDSEVSSHDGRPKELYKFEGTYENYYYTSGPKTVNFEGNDYVPIPMRRSNAKTGTQEDDNLEVTIEIPITVQMIATYGFQIAPPTLTLTIYRLHETANPIQFWKGPVEDIKVVKGVATIRIPSQLAVALSADIPNIYYQSPCNNVLYDNVCGVDYALFSHIATVSSFNGQVIDLDGIGALDAILLGGEAVLPSGERRMIVSQTGNQITVNYPFALIQNGDMMTIAAGCDLNWDGDCKTKFNNQLRHTGFNFIPPENVFQDGLEPGQNVADETCLPPMFEGWLWEWVFIVSNNGTGSTAGIWNVNYPGAGGILSNTTPNGGLGGLVYQQLGRILVDGIEYYRVRVTEYPEPGDYLALFDPPNFAGNNAYSVGGRAWNTPFPGYTVFDTVGSTTNTAPKNFSFTIGG